MDEEIDFTAHAVVRWQGVAGAKGAISARGERSFDELTAAIVFAMHELPPQFRATCRIDSGGRTFDIDDVIAFRREATDALGVVVDPADPAALEWTRLCREFAAARTLEDRVAAKAALDAFRRRYVADAGT